MTNKSDSTEGRLQELREIAKNYSQAEAERGYLDHFRKSKLAMLMKKYEPEHKTMAAQEREARADQEYLELLEGLRAATEKAEHLKWELNISRMGVDIWRTKQANRRKEREGYGA